MSGEFVISEEAKGLVAEASAKLTLSGVGINQQVKDLSAEFGIPLTRTKLTELKKHSKYAETLMEAAEAGKLQLKAGATGLVPDLLACLGSALKAGDTLGIRAAAIAASILTDKTAPDEQKQAQQLTVILPGTTPPSKP
jgi:hypothetical protein